MQIYVYVISNWLHFLQAQEYETISITSYAAFLFPYTALSAQTVNDFGFKSDRSDDIE